MPILVNGKVVTEQTIQDELATIARNPAWNDHLPFDRLNRMRAAAELAAIDRVLIEQLAALDTRSIDPQTVEREFQRLLPQSPPGLSEAALRHSVEKFLRLHRFRAELTSEAQLPTQEEVELFYYQNRDNFRLPELFTASHIVKHLNNPEDYDAALAQIQGALDELERGADFADVARSFSDCPQNGGYLGEFPSGYMVADFETEIAAIEPGERTGIFTTPIGFHIAMLHSRKSQGLADLGEARRDIEQVMTFAKKHQAYQRRTAELRSLADIRKVPDEE